MKKNIYKFCLCGFFAALTAIGAFIKIPLPLVPFTLQALACFLSGVLLGARYGFISQFIYLSVGLIGIPVFTNGGGITYVFQPTFGYLIGFMIASFLIGFILKNKKKNFKNILIACILGLIVLYVIGIIYMYLISNFYLGKQMSIWKVIYVGGIVSLPGDLLVCLLTSLISVKIIPILKKQGLY